MDSTPSFLSFQPIITSDIPDKYCHRKEQYDWQFKVTGLFLVQSDACFQETQEEANLDLPRRERRRRQKRRIDNPTDAVVGGVVADVRRRHAEHRTHRRRAELVFG